MSLLPNAYALIVGIAAYQNIRPLPAVVRADANAVYELLINPNYCGYAAENVRVLLDQEATLDNLSGALAELAQRAHPDSTVLIYVSSHGQRIQKPECAGTYLLPVDVAGSSECALAGSALSGDELTRALRKISAQKVIVLLDCCYAGGIAEPKDALAKTIPSGLRDADYARLSAGSGRVIIAAASADEQAQILHRDANSLFTRHLLDALRGDAAGDDGLIRVMQVYDYLYQRVTRDYAGQHTVFKGELHENFALALAKPSQRESIPLPQPAAYDYDVYLSYADAPLEAAWVREQLVPRLRVHNLCIALAHYDEQLGAPQIVGIENIVQRAKYTLAVCSRAYLHDPVADYTNVLAQTLYISRQEYRLIPLWLESGIRHEMPLRLAQLNGLNVWDESELAHSIPRLIHALESETK